MPGFARFSVGHSTAGQGLLRPPLAATPAQPAPFPAAAAMPSVRFSSASPARPFKLLRALLMGLTLASPLSAQGQETTRPAPVPPTHAAVVKAPAVKVSWFKSFSNTLVVARKKVETFQHEAEEASAHLKQLNPTPVEKAHLDKAYRLLATDKLGGRDGLFNQNDLRAISDALVKDPVIQRQITTGISRKADEKTVYREDGQLRRPVGRALANAIVARKLALPESYAKLYAQGEALARQQIETELHDALAGMGNTQADARHPDTQPRRLSLRDLTDFKVAVKGVKAYTVRLQQEAGALKSLFGQPPSPAGASHVTFPKGIGQADIQAISHQLQPPHAVFRPR